MSHSKSQRGKPKSKILILKKLLMITGCLLVIVGTVLWFSRHAIANAVIDGVLVKVASKAKKVGIELVDLDSGEIEIPSPLEARVQQFRTDFDIGVPNKNKVRSRFESQNIELTAAGIFPPMARIQLQDFSLKFHPDDVPDDFPFDGFRSGSFLSAPLSVLDPEQALRNTLSGLETLFDENEVKADFNFSGYVSVQVQKDVSVDALLYTERLDGGVRRLRFKREDLQQIVEKADVRISDEMLDILSEYPLRAPVIILISHKAKQDAEAKKKQEYSYPDDAFRHINWSYQLTKLFGPEFAKRVTDSHETLDGNTVNERLMDFHNNAVARALVADGVKVEALEEIILSDPRVIRSPHEVPSYKGLLK
ncbi:hypothetical protein BSZ32_15800 [Rubritalea profundi]|uniref:DUF6973 domain-containing protein n=1 Tax=Rubritalea profundi TaxID=1658618 RepID=A0A2S7U449_9BACT|nr:hypothetical protein BSZ32_15800 [Rubritalea profundi]